MATPVEKLSEPIENPYSPYIPSSTPSSGVGPPSAPPPRRSAPPPQKPKPITPSVPTLPESPAHYFPTEQERAEAVQRINEANFHTALGEAYMAHLGEMVAEQVKKGIISWGRAEELLRTARGEVSQVGFTGPSPLLNSYYDEVFRYTNPVGQTFSDKYHEAIDDYRITQAQAREALRPYALKDPDAEGYDLSWKKGNITGLDPGPGPPEPKERWLWKVGDQYTLFPPLPGEPGKQWWGIDPKVQQQYDWWKKAKRAYQEKIAEDYTKGEILKHQTAFQESKETHDTLVEETLADPNLTHAQKQEIVWRSYYKHSSEFPPSGGPEAEKLTQRHLVERFRDLLPEDVKRGNILREAFPGVKYPDITFAPKGVDKYGKPIPQRQPEFERVFEEQAALTGSQPWQDWFERRYGTLLRQFKATTPKETEAEPLETSWADFLRQRKPQLKEEYYAQSPYARGERPSAFQQKIKTVNF
tara:strand:+ start:534 stop:1949 length:1416 start_codon:yes stop_codon:yes gene_type:complete